MLLVALATVVLYILFIRSLPQEIGQISSASGLFVLIQTALGGVLAVVLGLELSETLKAYFARHQVRLEVILVLATIAVSRYLIQVDFEHTPAVVVLGLGAVILCLTVGYLLVRKANMTLPEGRPPAGPQDEDGSARMRR
jgi:uncharacterized membrane protein (DUF373 family)